MSFIKYSLSFFQRILCSRHVSVTAISSGSHMVGLSKNSSRLISRTNVRMHANADISEIRPIEGLRVAKEIHQVMMGTKSTGAEELVTTAAVMTRGMTREVTMEMKGLVPVAGTLMIVRISIDECSEDEWIYGTGICRGNWKVKGRR